MSNSLLLRVSLALIVSLVGRSLSAQHWSGETARRSADAPPQVVRDRFDAVPVQDQFELSRLAPGIKPKRMAVTLRDGAAVPADVAGGTPNDRLVYSNTLGRVAIDFGANRLISDDITITSTGRNDEPEEDEPTTTCQLTRIAFQVDGRVSEAMGQPSGPYTVNFALYNTCPYAVTAGAQRNSRIIPSSAGTVQVADDSPLWLEVELPAGVYAYTNMWFAVQFSRANAGLVSGTPAQEGHSGDTFDFPGSACNASLGGFPTAPHGSFNIEIWGDTLSCPQAYVAYKNIRESGSGINAGGTQPADWITDDITLQNACTALGFTVGVRAPGTYNFQLRSNCGAPLPIGGFTPSQIVGQGSGQEPRVFEYLFPNPVNIAQSFSFAVSVNNLGAGAIVTGTQASIGQTSDLFEVAPDCQPEDLRPGVMDSLHFSLICQGPAPLGACCDMFLTTCDGGMLDGELCDATAECQPTCSEGFCKINGVTILNDQEQPTVCADNSQCPTGTCNATCKEVPQTNCPFPARFTLSDISWEEGKTCASDPNDNGAFPGLICGQGACCTDENTCSTVTYDECLTLPDEWLVPVWKPGRICDGQMCTRGDCLGSEDCLSGPHGPGCSDMACCSTVCEFDPFCCEWEWDGQCVAWAQELCLPPATDDCGSGQGAVALSSNDSIVFSNRDASTSATDAGLCSIPSESRCVRNGLVQERCPLDGNCATGGVCTSVSAFGFKTVWFQFVATHTSARIRTCNSYSGNDSILQIYQPQDTSSGEAACASLVPIACTIADGCMQIGQSCLCVTGLTPGKTYYIMAASKSPESAGVYQLDISSPCSGPPCCPRQDCNANCVFDGMEIALNDEADCDQNEVLDSCELQDHAMDCNGNGSLDACESSIPFDTDSDDDLDLKDFAFLQTCFADDQWQNECCRMVDHVGPEELVNQSDYAQFRLSFSGPL